MSTAMKLAQVATDWAKVRDGWIAAIEGVFSDVESWSRARSWDTYRESMELEEPGLGRYQAGRLWIRSPWGLMKIEPVASQVRGATGLIDFLAPGNESAEKMLSRQEDGRWLIHPLGDATISRPWSETDFFETVMDLSRAIG